jgi:hypothetical protein
LLTPAELDDDLARLDDPLTLFPSPLMWTVCGRRAAVGAAQAKPSPG